MKLEYYKSDNGKYVIKGFETITDNNQSFLELYNRFEQAVRNYGFKKYNKNMTVLELESQLTAQGFNQAADKIGSYRKTRNLLVHGTGIDFTVSIEMIKGLISLIIDREERIKK